jgi:hypothetical protein
MGLIEHGLVRQDRDLSLTRYRDRCGATVFVTGREHAIVQGTGWQMTPWAAVQNRLRSRPCTGARIGAPSRRFSCAAGEAAASADPDAHEGLAVIECSRNEHRSPASTS